MQDSKNFDCSFYDISRQKITNEKTGEFIKCTPNHLIATKNRGWVEAQNLKEDDELTVKRTEIHLINNL